MKVVKTKTTVEFEPGDVVKSDSYVWVRLRNGNWAATDMGGWQDNDTGSTDGDFARVYLQGSKYYQFLTFKD
jgi:hypothetical protein